MAQKNKYIPVKSSSAWIEWCWSLLDLYTTDKYFRKHTEVEKINFLRMKRWIMAQDFKSTDKILNFLLLDALMSAESKATGSGSYVPYFLFNDDDVILGRKSSSEYFELVKSLRVSDKAKETFETFFKLAGPLTKIITKETSGHDIVIKYRGSFSFPLKLDPQFQRMIGHTDLIEQTNPLVLMIEGAPETVAEINPLLTRNFETKRPVLLVARSFPEEISATLATNWVKGSLSVLPMTYGTSLDTINLAADLCAVTKGELISPHFGDIITTALLDEDKWGQVDRLEWTYKGVNLYSSSNVDRHVKRIIDKLESTTEEEVENLLRERILSLSNDALEIWIPKDTSGLLQEIDQMIRHYNAYVVSGVADTKIGKMPIAFVRTAKEAAESLREKILNIGGFLVRVDDEVVA